MAVRGCGSSWSLELSLEHGLVGAAGAVPGVNVHSEVGEDPHRDGLGHPRRRSDRGAAGEKRHRPLSPLPVQRQQHPALGRTTRRGDLLNGGGGEAVAATAGHQDIQHVRRGQRAIGSRSVCSGPQHRVCRCLSVQRRLVGRCCRRGGRRDGGCRTRLRRGRFPRCRYPWRGGGCSTPREQRHRSSPQPNAGPANTGPMTDMDGWLASSTAGTNYSYWPLEAVSSPSPPTRTVVLATIAIRGAESFADTPRGARGPPTPGLAERMSSAATRRDTPRAPKCRSWLGVGGS